MILHKKLPLIFVIIFSLTLLAQDATAQSKKTRKTSRTTRAANANVTALRSQLSSALAMVRNKEYEKAAVALHALSQRRELSAQRIQIKYILGVTLMELNLHQVAAFQFVDVIRRGSSRYTQQAIEKLSLVADILGDDSLLNYAISKVQLSKFPEKYKDMVYFRLAEIKLKNGAFDEAASLFGQVRRTSRYSVKAKFNRGLAFLEKKDPASAIRVYNQLWAEVKDLSITDDNRVATLMALARAHYQAQNWDKSLEYYRQVPKDHTMWHDALFEMGWADLRSARFRSALSKFQSLHSSYYEEFYIPESLLLRSIVYLFICKYDEMEKVLNLFNKTYGPVRSDMGRFLKEQRDPTAIYEELARASLRREGKSASLQMSYIASRHILSQGDIKRTMTYLKKIEEEQQRWNQSSQLSRATISRYAARILANRIKNTKVSIGEMAKTHMFNMRAELKELYEQASFIRYEMINGKKEQLKKKIAEKGSGKEQTIDENVNRDFFIDNGYEYYPFQGEYWLDEIGNYHYLGKQSCE